ncbi:MAG: hypothetical protein RBS24_00085 [Bacilli bacterium]|nr:hypothetical protein [Bacilli bacterium]
MMEMLPNLRAKELTPEHIKLISTIKVSFRYRTTHYQGSFVLVFRNEEREYYFTASINDVLRVFPDMSETSLKDAGIVDKRMPMRIFLGKATKNNDFGYYARFELLILNENKNVIHDMFSSDVRDQIIKNYKSLKDYVIFKDGITHEELVRALKEKGRY